MAYTAECRTGQIEAQIPNMAELVVDIIAEKIQEEHIADDMHKTLMQKGVTNELPQVRPTGSEHKLQHPGSKFQITCNGVFMVLQQKNNRIDGYEGVVYVWRSFWPNVCPDR